MVGRKGLLLLVWWKSSSRRSRSLGHGSCGSRSAVGPAHLDEKKKRKNMRRKKRKRREKKKKEEATCVKQRKTPTSKSVE